MAHLAVSLHGPRAPPLAGPTAAASAGELPPSESARQRVRVEGGLPAELAVDGAACVIEQVPYIVESGTLWPAGILRTAAFSSGHCASRSSARSWPPGISRAVEPHTGPPQPYSPG